MDALQGREVVAKEPLYNEQMRAFVGVVLIAFFGYACQYDSFEDMANAMTREIPFQKKWDVSENWKVIDCRSREEYAVSHLQGAIWVGENNSNLQFLQHKDSILVYCSVGYRSGLLTQQLRDSGFENTYNLWGGIFNVINQNGVIVNTNGPTINIHPYNEKWGKWLNKGEQQYEE